MFIELGEGAFEIALDFYAAAEFFAGLGDGFGHSLADALVKG